MVAEGAEGTNLGVAEPVVEIGVAEEDAEITAETIADGVVAEVEDVVRAEGSRLRVVPQSIGL